MIDLPESEEVVDAILRHLYGLEIPFLEEARLLPPAEATTEKVKLCTDLYIAADKVTENMAIALQGF